jgi:hypothetical protein
MGRSLNLKLALVAWLATNFLSYRIGLWWMSAPNLCNCLGNLNQYLSVSPRVLNAAGFAALGWMLIGSYALMLAEWGDRPVKIHLEAFPQNAKT